MADNMQMTLLQIVQSILSSMNSDEVNSISDTAESLQVARAVEQTYWNMLGRYDLPEHNQLFQLTPSNDPTLPCLMFRPPGCTRIEWIKYFDTNPLDSGSVSTNANFSHGLNVDLVNSSSWSTTSSTSNTIGLGIFTFTVGSSTLPTISGQQVTAQAGTAWMTGTLTSYVGTTMTLNITSSQGLGTFTSWNIFAGGPTLAPGYKWVKILPIEDFINYTAQFNSQNDNVGLQQVSIADPATGTPNLFQFRFRTDITPQHCAVMSNNYIVFDSYDNTQDSTLQASKTMVWGWIYPTFNMVDTFVPQLDAQQFPLLLNDAKALVFFEQKQFPHLKAEEEVGKQVVSLQKWKALAGRVSDEKDMFFQELPNFGR